MKILVILSGFLATCTQVLLIREITTVFQGNELMMSWTLGAWMLLTGIGALLGRLKIRIHKGSNFLERVLLLLAFSPVVLVLLLNILKSTLFPPGIMVNPAYFLLILTIFLSPVCLLSGYIYSLLINYFCSENIGFNKVYTLEAVGSLIGGLIVSFALVQWLSVIQSFLILLLFVALLFAIMRKEKLFYFAATITFASLLLSGFLQLDKHLKSLLFVNQKVLESEETYYGNVTITESAGQYNFFGNGSLLYTTDNTISNEEYTHYALLQQRNPKDVLLVSGGIGGMIAEILKYRSVENVDYVELNPRLIGLAAKYTPLPKDNRVHLIFDDGRRTIQRMDKKYDIAIFAVPDPSSLQINRFYTNEFLALLKQKLNPGAIVLYAVSSSGNYMSAEKTGIETAVYNTLKNNFQQVEIIPGERDYFLASDAALRVDIAKLSGSSGVTTKFVNANYIDDFSIIQRGKLIKENLKEKIINQDDKPLPVYFHTLQFISEYTSKGRMLILIPVIILLIPLLFMRAIASGMYISGFTASAFEILIIFTFQTFFGYVYSAIGLIIAIFMGGLAIGSIVGNRFNASKNHFLVAQVMLALYSLLFPIFWSAQKELANGLAGLLLFGLITIVLSTIVGFQYIVGTKILPDKFTKTAPLLYGVDLIGAALGIVVVSVILLPVAGVINSCVIIAGVNLLITIFMVIRKK